MMHLKKYRALRNISQEELSKKVDIHVVQLSKYERGLSAPSIKVVERLAEALEISIDELVHGETQNQIEQAVSDKEFISLFKKVQTLSEREKETVKDLLSAFVLKSDLKQKLAS
jgi:transcriptional regulator with XRE-family HTH domain